MRTCGGCEGKGSHWRWCPDVVGRVASRMGQLSQRADNLADEVGSNNPGAANHLYQAAALLREQARERTTPPTDHAAAPTSERGA